MQPSKFKTRTKYTPKARTVSLNSAAWKRLRAQVLAEEPLCRACAASGLVSKATDVDHISNDGDDNSRDNLQPLCHECHSCKTRAEMLGRPVTLKGCDVNGQPLDPAHPWNRS
ncbi:MAG: HNH endonuclease signature motif containing protein [Pseudomonadota bacterium]